MYNSDIPSRAELPTTRQLIKSTIIAIISAIVILVTIVLPSEYAIDPTGVGKVLNLTEMGEIKQQLHAEAEADRQLELQKGATDDTSSSLLDGLLGLFVGSAHAQSASATWTDTVSYTLTPGEGIEVKLVMQEGAEAEFLWAAEGGNLNYDLHGDGSGNELSYEKGRAVPGHDGVLKAAFTGNHGWFWRNRDKQDVTVTLSVRGAYSEVVLPK
ncbi:MAG: transmembrane anchor protein [Hoeflea sp.]|uniref:transmembrane anchor protein n=1 Tax=Hoeflea sp. TaxID=1940281 RepID=UPI001DA213E7|nr:transmembrane anchor protein [Hoeflea sp.]MBU4530750.1 transmembrane anchor protein [Alphaproteobacteria bacterium]MBU4544749.1 transmembrane anchor protein [Alphaproteobacteria bacterium]MBU4549305.1 transmembrane anchor protein [Alphaproteobacteria bacterium]MBV1726344.1 transmembrane anchor protein [Hoeflea sp.]MBV1761686.1 transmembrane anchor protein [Hoeflea sp.]